MNDWQLRLAVRVLARGDVVLHATEGVWGFACDPWRADAVERLLDCKGRDAGKGLILIGAGRGCFDAELLPLADEERSRIETSWPGAVTWIVPNRRFPPWITGGRDTVAVRVPGHPQARALCRGFGGPLVSTSANPAGRPPARRRLQARALLETLRERQPAAVIHLLPGETLGRRGPSEIRALSGERLRASA